jgi:hypothetical protein
LAQFKATAAMRSDASRTRRQRETQRLIDRLVDAEDDAEMERVWDGLTPRQQELVNDQLDREMTAKRETPK